MRPWSGRNHHLIFGGNLMVIMLIMITFTGSAAGPCFGLQELHFDRFVCCKRSLAGEVGFQLRCKVRQERIRSVGYEYSDNFNLWRAYPDLVVHYSSLGWWPKLTIDCTTATPAVPSLLTHLSIERVIHLEYMNCEIPRGNLTFSKMLGRNQAVIRMFSIEEPQNCTDCALYPALFDGIASGIRNLEITSEHRRIRLSDDFFQGFTSLVDLKFQARSTSLPSSMRNLKNLISLDISANSIIEMPPRSFSGMSSLKSLTMAMFPAEKFSFRPFAGLENLETLKLGGMRVTSIDEDFFGGLDKLAHLSLFDWGTLKSFPENLFKNTPSLKTLSLSSILRVEALPDGFFRRLEKLKKVTIISGERGSGTLPLNLWPVEELQEVIISESSLRSLPGGFFPNGNKLRALTIRQNQLEDVEKGLKNLRKLKKLHLEWNKLASISATLFENLSNLEIVDLSHNRITSVDYRAFIELTTLEVLKLNDNLITHLSARAHVFPVGCPLSFIDISNNRLTEFPSFQLETLQYISSIRLENNYLTFYEVTRFTSTRTSVYLTNNRIEIISVESVKDEGVLGHGSYEIHIANNPIKCSGENFDFFRYIKERMTPALAMFPDLERAFCSGTKKSLLDVRLEELTSEHKDCPTVCNCSFFHLEKSVKVFCENRGLSEMPELPPNITHLIFNGNSLKTYPKELTTYGALKVVNLDHNRIRSIDSMLGNSPQQLEEISLRHNELERWRPDHEDLHFDLDITDNPWICDCAADGFRVFLRRHFWKIKNYKEIRCKEPVWINGRDEILLSKMSSRDLCPPKNTKLVIQGVASVVVFIMISAAMILYIKNRNLVIALAYVHLHRIFLCFSKEEDLDDDTEFDAFLSFSAEDRDVATEILRHLETEVNENDTIGAPFSLCIHERDFMPGQTITWNILNSVKLSRRTILILSEKFLESVWLKIEFQAAYNRMRENRLHRLIIVIKGELPPHESLSEDLKGVLRMKTYLLWGERWFWKKLLYAMPHRCRKAAQNHQSCS